jgi:MFS family permease
VTVIARRELPADELLAALATLTVAFAAGQLLGPTLFGALSDVVGLRISILASASVLFAAAVAAWLQPGGSRQSPGELGGREVALSRTNDPIEVRGDGQRDRCV